MAVAQNTGIPEWVALASGNMVAKTRGLPLLFEILVATPRNGPADRRSGSKSRKRRGEANTEDERRRSIQARSSLELCFPKGLQTGGFLQKTNRDAFCWLSGHRRLLACLFACLFACLRSVGQSVGGLVDWLGWAGWLAVFFSFVAFVGMGPGTRSENLRPVRSPEDLAAVPRLGGRGLGRLRLRGGALGLS